MTSIALAGSSYTLLFPHMARILLVDDYPDALDVWSLYLKMCGFDVVSAGDGLTALDVARRERPDLAILDLELPGISGLELARRMRADEALTTVPLIAVTGHSQLSRIEEAERAGFDLVLTKPCDPEKLCLEIQRLLDESAANSTVPPDALDR
jgi:two-component system cell cycle response regulator DivK